MQEYGFKNPSAKPAEGLTVAKAHWNLTPDELIKRTVNQGIGVLSDTGALCVDTGKFTGRSPKDKFTVKDDITRDTVDWGEINIPTTPEIFDNLYNKVCQYLEDKEVYVRDSYACADPDYRLNIRVVNETPWSSLFCHNLFQRPTEEEIKTQEPDWHIIQVPSFFADPETDGTRQGNFTMVNFTRKVILIGGSEYTGEIKKGIFGVLNFILPNDRHVLSMHCSANEGKDGDVCIFFGLSGTGKTTLSADPNRALIGDDEHGWTDDTVFNIEGGCYAKCIDLSPEKEPQIFGAIRKETILENTRFKAGTNEVDYSDTTVTPNTRAAYPLYLMDNIKKPSYGGQPQNIFFLTCDAFGILPPVAKLTTGQAMYHFISGYTAKVAGTEVGVSDPQPTFSACFGKVFMPLHPTKYAELLGEKLEQNPDINVWLVNTGWTGGAFGTGERMSLKHTRTIVRAAMAGKLNDANYTPHPVFGVLMPDACPDVPSEILNPRDTWEDKAAYDKKANDLAKRFEENFKEYVNQANDDIRAAAPKVGAVVND